MVSVYIRSALVQFSTPDTMRGRVNAVNMLFISSSNELGEFRAGSMAAALGAVPAAIVGSLCTLGVVAAWMQRFSSLRQVDRLARYGGEEFVVAAPGIDLQGGLEMAERLRRAVADASPGGHRVTASLGVADCDENQLDGLLAKADEYLYAAKEAGRNRIMSRDGLASEACA